MSRWLQYAIKPAKVLSIIICFIVFADIVHPKVSEYVIPYLLDLSRGYREPNRGIDLDPIYLSEGGSAVSKVTGLYSTRHAYVGNGIYGDLVTSDSRVLAMNLFLSDYSSPMAPWAETFVLAADENGLDWRLVASISGVESAFGRLIPYDTFNAWGWRGGPGGEFSEFGSWAYGISMVSSGIANGYGSDIDPFTMESIYCPPCGQVPTHDWANGVARYTEELDAYRKNLK